MLRPADASNDGLPAGADREGHEPVVTYVDVIGLKKINDDNGDAAGAALLTRVVARINARLRPDDLIIRLGGTSCCAHCPM